MGPEEQWLNVGELQLAEAGRARSGSLGGTDCPRSNQPRLIMARTIDTTAPASVHVMWPSIGPAPCRASASTKARIDRLRPGIGPARTETGWPIRSLLPSCCQTPWDEATTPARLESRLLLSEWGGDSRTASCLNSAFHSRRTRCSPFFVRCAAFFHSPPPAPTLGQFGVHQVGSTRQGERASGGDEGDENGCLGGSCRSTLARAAVRRFGRPLR